MSAQREGLSCDRAGPFPSAHARARSAKGCPVNPQRQPQVRRSIGSHLPSFLRVAAPALVFAAGLGLATAAHATDARPQPLWELGLGLGALQLPHYRGSDQQFNQVLPVPYFIYRGRFLRATRDGARAVLVDSQRVEVDLSLGATPPLASSDNRARSGMADLPATVEFGPNLNVTLAEGRDWKFDLRVPVRAGLTVQRDPRSVGWTAGPLLNLDLRSGGWRLGAQGGPVYGTQRFNAFFYDVPAADATATRPAYASRGGYGGWRWTLAASRRFERLWVGGFVRQDRVDGAVFESSPLVRQRSHWSAGIAMSWVFAVSDERVVVDD